MGTSPSSLTDLVDQNRVDSSGQALINALTTDLDNFISLHF